MTLVAPFACRVPCRARCSAAGPDLQTAYGALKSQLRDVAALSEVEGILGYDEQCFLPPGAAPARAAQKAALAKVVHQMRTGDAMRDAVEAVRGREDELTDARARANVRDAVASFDKEARKSAELAEREARLESETYAAWRAAREASDFQAFAPKLAEMFELKRLVAETTRPEVRGRARSGHATRTAGGLPADVQLACGAVT